jgi:transcriptional regulator with XRE-family HTH domain
VRRARQPYLCRDTTWWVPMSELGDRIRDRRKGAGMSQRQLADKVSVGFPHLSKIENGAETPSDELLTKIADAVGDDVDELMAIANRVSPELAETVIVNPNARMFRRLVRSGDISDKDLENLMKRRRKG